MSRKVSRRGFLQLTAAAGAALLSTGLAGHMGGHQPGSAQAAEPFEAYHGKTGAEHQANFDRLSGQGYRIISLSVYGDPTDPRYAAVWVQRSGPDWVAVHGVDAAGYQAFFDKQTAAGYAPVLVSATGPFATAIFAAVFEQSVSAPWTARHGLTGGDFDSASKAAAQAKQYLRSVATYGTASDRRYAAVWHSSDRYIRWYYHGADPEASYQTTFDSETQVRGYRLAYVALSSDHVYCSVFRDELIGDWSARHGLTTDQYQAEFDKQTANGFYPICVQGGGSGADTHYAAIFAKRDGVTDYDKTLHGDAAPTLTGFDDLIWSFMRTNGIRAGQLAIASGGAVKLSHAYTLSETGSNYPSSDPMDSFRLASCSKIFLEAAVQSLYDAKQLTPATKVYPLLGFSKPADPRSDDITIQQLLDHTGGYDDSAAGSNFDPTYRMVDIAKAAGLTRAVTKQDVMQYMYARKLDYTPGTTKAGDKYSNYGYLLAGAVVEKVTGSGFFDYINSTLLRPLGISQVQPAHTEKSAQPINEPHYEDGGMGVSALQPTSSTQVAAAYGGNDQILEVADSAAGLSASAAAIVKFIHVHKVWGNGLRSAYAATELPSIREGRMSGTSSWAVSRGDGVDWAMIFNTSDWPAGVGDPIPDLGKSIDALLDKTSLA